VLTDWFKERGYEESFVQQQIGSALGLDRESLNRRSEKQKNQDREDRVPLVTTYHPAHSSMIRVVHNLHHMLKSTEELRKVFPDPPFIAFRRCKNLKDILVRSKLYSAGQWGL